MKNNHKKFVCTKRRIRNVWANICSLGLVCFNWRRFNNLMTEEVTLTMMLISRNVKITPVCSCHCLSLVRRVSIAITGCFEAVSIPCTLTGAKVDITKVLHTLSLNVNVKDVWMVCVWLYWRNFLIVSYYENGNETVMRRKEIIFSRYKCFEKKITIKK